MKSSMVSILATVALGAASLSWGCGDDAGGSGGDSDGDSDGDVDTDRDDGATRVAIDLAGSLQNPAWSPGGDTLLFTRFREGYNAEPADLFFVDLEGGAPSVLVSDDSCNVNLPGSVWSASAAMIVFSSSRVPHDEIYAIEAGGSNGDEWAITEREGYMAYEPTLSPDGEWVVFESHVVDEEDNGVITKFRVDGTGDYIALTDPEEDCRQPNWSPGGGTILYQRFDGSQWDVWTMNDDGTGAVQVTDGPGDKTDASFSPDGDWIVYSSDEGELDLANIFVIPAVGGDPVRVTEWDGYDGAPSWSPDGSRIAFESYPGDPDECPGTAIWIIDAPSL
jgi:TolB protein